MQPLLCIEHVSLRFPMMDKSILDDIHYHVMRGDFVVILGGNGSGKSSLLKSIDKTYVPTSGSILYRERNIKSYPLNQYYRLIKTITQSTVDSLFANLTIYENYQLFSGVIGSKTFHSTQELCDYLAEFNVNLASKLDQAVCYLSGGEKQSLLLALTFLNPPDLLLLDEHTSALDPKSADKIMTLTNDMIRKHHMTCLLTTHDLDIAVKYGDRLLALKEGKVHHVADIEQKNKLRASDLRELCY